jgi:GDSL-like Lipase/Acylhydrolase family
MKRLVLLLLSLAPLAFAASTPAKSAPPVAKEFAPIVDDAKLPRVLIIGDSVSVAYTLDVRKNLAGVANVHRIPANGGSTRTALGEYGLIRWLKPGEKWDVIHFNEGLHDLSYRFPDDRDKNDKGEYASPTNGGRPNVSLEQYEKNLRLIVARLKQTGAKLIFGSTTPVPEADAAKYVKDSELPYNVVAKKVMAEEGVTWNDLWAAVKPKQDQLQGKRNVHFMASGSAVLAKQVAEAITRELPQPTSK